MSGLHRHHDDALPADRAEALASAVFSTTVQDINRLGIDGSAFFGQTDQTLWSRIQIAGLEPNETHLMHIHGRVDEDGLPLDSVTPTLADDTDGDGFIELLEGLPRYGPIIGNLTSPVGGELDDFPTAPNGRIDFREAYDLDDPAFYNGDFGREQLLPLTLREFVVHGASVPEGVGEGTPGEVDGTGGFKLLLPVGSGELEPATLVYTADLTTLNDSGVTGSVNLLLQGDELTVHVRAQGLEPGEIHVQHIHGPFDSEGRPIEAVTPTLEQDTDGDGFIEVFEGAATYGPVLVDLTDPVGAGLEGFPTAPNGEVRFSTTLDLNDPASFAAEFDRTDVLPLSLREIVLHGLTVDGTAGEGTPGEVDGTPGYKLILPVASGTIEFAGIIDGRETVLPPVQERVDFADPEAFAVDASRLRLSAGDVNFGVDPMVAANADTNGIASADSALDATPDATITFVDEHAAFQNTLGAFLIDEQGGIGPVATVFSAIEHQDALPGPGSARPGGGDFSPGDSVRLADLFDPDDLTAFGGVGLFLVADGGNANPPEVFGEGELRFVDAATGGQASLHTDPAELELRHVDADGNEQAVEGRVVHALSELNPQGEVLVLGGIDPLDGILQLAFEDGQDRDFNDLQIAFDNGTGGDRVVSAAEIEQLFTLPASPSVDQVVTHDHAAMAA